MPEVVSKAISEYRATNDWFARFVSECCDVAPNASEQSSAVYNVYRQYCAVNDEPVRSTTEFYKALSANGFSRKKSVNCVTIYGMKLRTCPCTSY